MNFKLVFRCLSYRNYRLFFFGQVISLIGTWMQSIAVGWLVYRLTNSALLLGVAGFASQIPTFVFSPFAGVIADRHNKHRLLVITQSLAMLQAVVLTILVLTNHIVIWQIIALGSLLGIVNCFDIPIRQSFIIEMIEKKEDLGNAIALNSSMFNIAKLLGPAFAGIIIAIAGEGVCFLLNAVSYIAVIVSLLAMKITYVEKNIPDKRMLSEIKDGLKYVMGFAPIKYIIFLLAMTSLVGVPYQVLMPVFARDVFHGDSRKLGFLVAMSGVGALTGAIYLAGRKKVIGLENLIMLNTASFGLAIIAVSFCRNLWLAMFFILAAGFSMMVQMASSNTILQTVVDDDKRGRVMSFYTMAFMGTMPFGSLFAGTLATKIGAPATLLIGGVCCVIGALLFSGKLPVLREKIRLVYLKKGIIPAIPTSI